MRSIASEPEDTHVYNVADFNVMSSIVEGLTKTVCEQVEQQDKDIKQSKKKKELSRHQKQKTAFFTDVESRDYPMKNQLLNIPHW